MNFKPSLWKVIFSLIIGWVAIPFLLGLIIELATSNDAEISNYGVIYIISIIGIVLTYIIWSLIEKKKK